MTRALATLDLPLVKAMAPARFSRPISVISAPLRPRVMAAMTCTLTMALSRARRWMKSTSATWSMTGSVSGMTTMVVTPPAAAAWLAVFRVSRCSRPGSPVNTCMSIRPGQSTWPLQSTTWARSGALRRRCAPEIGDHAVLDQQPARLVLARGRIDQARVEEDRRLLCRWTALAHAALLCDVRRVSGWAAAAPSPRAPPCARRRPSPPGRG